jgi:signal peptidase I
MPAESAPARSWSSPLCRCAPRALSSHPCAARHPPRSAARSLPGRFSRLEATAETTNKEEYFCGRQSRGTNRSAGERPATTTKTKSRRSTAVLASTTAPRSVTVRPADMEHVYDACTPRTFFAGQSCVAEKKTLSREEREAMSGLSQWRHGTTQVLNFALVLGSALAVWKGLMALSGSESPIVVVLSGSMEPAYYKGDLLFLWNDHRDQLEVGEVMVFSLDGRDTPIVHRILEAREEMVRIDAPPPTDAKDPLAAYPTVRMLTKGDHNAVDDRGLYNRGQVWLERKHIIGRARLYVTGGPPFGLLPGLSFFLCSVYLCCSPCLVSLCSGSLLPSPPFSTFSVSHRAPPPPPPPLTRRFPSIQLPPVRRHGDDRDERVSCAEVRNDRHHGTLCSGFQGPDGLKRGSLITLATSNQSIPPPPVFLKTREYSAGGGRAGRFQRTRRAVFGVTRFLSLEGAPEFSESGFVNAIKNGDFVVGRKGKRLYFCCRVAVVAVAS